MYQHRYGPFTPQELDPMLKWLEKSDVTYDLIRDDQGEKNLTDNSPSNMLAVSEFRTKVYLAQIFYLDIQFASSDFLNSFESKFIYKSEVVPIWINKVKDMATKPLVVGHENRKSFWARAIVLYLVLSYIIAYFLNRKS